MGTPETVTPAAATVPPEVETAKVSRSAAVWVAAITAIGGFATAVAAGAFGLVGKSKPPPKQRWLRVEAVQLVRDPALPAVRGVDEYPLHRIPLRGATQALQLSTSDQQGLATGMVVRYSTE